MDEAEAVQSVYGNGHFGSVEPRVVFPQNAALIQQRPQIAARNIFLPINLINI